MLSTGILLIFLGCMVGALLIAFLKICTGRTASSSNSIPPVVHKTLPVDNHVVEKFVFVDVETANKDKTSICAVAVSTIHAGRISSKRWFVRPPKNDFYFTYLHGITWDMVKDAPTFDEIWTTELLPRFSGKAVVAHYAHFDISAILDTLDYYHIPYKDFCCSDTCILARCLIPSLSNHKLNTLTDHFGIKLDHHNPLSDVAACANIFNILLQTFPDQVMTYLSMASLYRNKSTYNADFFGKDIF